MGCVSTITYDKFPKQKDENYKFPKLAVGSRVAEREKRKENK